MLVYAPIPPTHANALQLFELDNGRLRPGPVKFQIDRLLVFSIYNESLMVHTIVFEGH